MTMCVEVKHKLQHKMQFGARNRLIHEQKLVALVQDGPDSTQRIKIYVSEKETLNSFGRNLI